MKIKDGYALRSVAVETVVVPCNSSLNFDSMITLNDTARFIWEKLQAETSEAEILKDMLLEYDVDEETAEKCISAFVSKLKELDFLE